MDGMTEVVNTGAGESVDAPQETVTDGSVESAEQTSDTNSDATAEGESQEQSADGIETVEQDGRKYVPLEAFEKRIAKLTAQKNEAHTLLEAIKSDPEVRRELLQSLNETKPDGVESRQPLSTNSGGEEVAPFKSFISRVPQEHQQFYNEFGKAISDEFTPYVERMVKEAIAPFMSFIGETKLSSIRKQYPDFNKYEPTVAKLMREKNVDAEEAYILASYRDKLKSAKSVGARSEADRRTKIQTPANNRPFSSGSTAKTTHKKTLDEAIANAMKKVGIQ